MSDMDVFAAMGISGFGKAPKKRQLDPHRFDKNKREEVCGFGFCFSILARIHEQHRPEPLKSRRTVLHRSSL